jgi:hypothetical protein
MPWHGPCLFKRAAPPTHPIDEGPPMSAKTCLQIAAHMTALTVEISDEVVLGCPP